MKTLAELLTSANSGVAQIKFQNEMIAQAVQKVAEEKQKAMMEDCVGLVNLATSSVSGRVTALRNIRKQEEAAKKDLEDVNKAITHFDKTGNPLPFLKVIGAINQIRNFCGKAGIPVPPDNDDAYKFE